MSKIFLPQYFTGDVIRPVETILNKYSYHESLSNKIHKSL